MYILGTFILSLAIALGIFGACVLGINFFYRSKSYRGALSDHFQGKRFYNIGWLPRESMRIERFDGKKGGFIYWLFHREKAKWQRREVTQVVPIAKNQDGVRITNIGHATYLIQTNGKNFLTDPVWSYRASPWEFFGPKRYTPPGVKLECLPKIDVILLSHNHYDHMDVKTLRWLYDRDFPTIYTGLGNRQYLEDRKIGNVIEMDWFEEMKKSGQISDDTSSEIISQDDFSVTFLPAQHFSARGVTDRNRTLWGGFRVVTSGMSLYFAGDTGYGDWIEKVREKFPEGFDIGLIPIGAYKPRWFMAPVHTDPFEGMQLQRDLDVRKAIGIHYGVFDLADDNQDDPVNDLAQAKNLPEYRDQVFDIGPCGTVWQW